MRTYYLRAVTSLFVFANSLFNAAWAQQSVGEWANNMVKGPIGGLGYTLNALSFVVGIGFILGAYIQYQAHRDNPQQVRLSTPIFMLAAGLFLIILPLTAWIAEGGSFLRPKK